ncbi:MAG: hypothetical protein ABI142_04560 [Bryocella sp.]
MLLLVKKRLFKKHILFAGILCGLAANGIIETAILFYRQELGIAIPTAYRVLFYSHWILFTCEAVLQVAVIYIIFRDAMAPLQGLQYIGKVIFRWVAGVSIVVSVAFAAGPHAGMSATNLYSVVAAIIDQIQQGVGVLTLCLLMFVTFSTKPLGLTYRSRAFGMLCGLGVMACSSLVVVAWAAVSPHKLYSPTVVFELIGCIAATILWITYFAMPEPEARMILLPTTSPFFLWNRISEALGDSPGFVAVAGFRPEMLATAEIEMMSAPGVAELEPAYSTSHSMAQPMLAAAAH